MVIEYIRYSIPDERADEFAAAYARGGAVLDTDPHCLGGRIRSGR